MDRPSRSSSAACWRPVHGIRQVNALGGITIAQDEDSASAFEMPCSAIDFGKAQIIPPPPRTIARALAAVAEQWSLPATP